MRSLITASLVILSLISLFKSIESFTCGLYDSSPASCNQDSRCTYITAESYCACNSTLHQDVLMIMDCSGSVGSTGWDQERQFVVDLINTGLTSQSRVGLIRYSSAIAEKYDFYKNQDRTVIASFVNGPNMDFTGGATYTRSAVCLGIDMYIRDSINTAFGNPMLMLLITDGVPYPNTYNPTNDPNLKIALDFYGIYPVIVGVGNFDRNTIKDMVADPTTQMIDATSFSQLGSVRTFLDTFTCPSTTTLTITEFRLEGDSSSDGGDVVWIELYNTGDTLYFDASASVPNFDFGSGATVQGSLVADGSGGTFFWEAGQLMVLYAEGTLSKRLHCYDCDCTNYYGTSSGSGFTTSTITCCQSKWCNDAEYIEIGYNSDGSHPSGATFDSTSNYDNTNFLFSAFLPSSQGSTQLFYLTYNAANNWPSVFSGFSYTRDSHLTAENDGNSWDMSCWTYGTPGDDPIDTCTRGCADIECRNFDISPTDSLAVASGDTCDCTDNVDDSTIGNGFYPNGCVCVPIDPPSDCYSYVYNDPNDPSIKEIISTWGSSATAPDVTYTFDYCSDGVCGYSISGSSSLVAAASNVFDYTKFSATVYAVHSTYTNVWSTEISCTIVTLDPTASPVQAPIYTVPIVTCWVTIIDNNQVVIGWPDVTLSSTDPPSIDYYRLYYYYNSADLNMDHDVTTDSSYITNCDSSQKINYVDAYGGDYCQKTYVSGATISDPDLLDVYMSPGIDNLYGVEQTTLMENNKQQCIIFTRVPSAAPSAGPNGEPTPSPIDVPTGTPTARPVVDGYSIDFCRVYFAPGTSTVPRLDFGGQYSSLHYSDYGEGALVNLEWRIVYSGTTYDLIIDSDSIDSPQYPNLPGSSLPTISDYRMYAEWDTYINGNDRSQSAEVTCAVQTDGPTDSPTTEPSDVPSEIPTGIPTGMPTSEPSPEPTMSPTFEEVIISNCYAQLYSGLNGFTLTFNNPTWNPPTTPDYTQVEYFIEWTDGGSIRETFSGSASATGATVYVRDITGVANIDESYTLEVTIIFSAGEDLAGEDAGPTYYNCEIQTIAPTVNGYIYPTVAPGFSVPECYFDLTKKYFEKYCDIPTDGTLPTCDFQEKGNSGQTFYVKREHELFSNDITYIWQIVCCDVEDISCDWDTSCDTRRRRRRRNLLQTTTADPNAVYYGDEDDFEELTDEEDLDGGSPGEGEFEVTIMKNDDENTPETSYIVLVSCSDSTGEYGCVIPAAGNPNKPSQVRMQIYDNGSGAFTSKKTGDLPSWIWYPIAAGIILLPILGWFGYRYYKKRKLNEEILEQRKHELGNLDGMDAVDEFGGIGDDVNFNPLATAGTVDIATTDQFVDKQLQQQKNQFQTAQVQTDTEVFRQEFGPQLAQKHNHTDFN